MSSQLNTQPRQPRQPQSVGVTLMVDAFECIDTQLHQRLVDENIEEWPIVDDMSAKTVAAILLRCEQYPRDLKPLVNYITGLKVTQDAVMLRLIDNKSVQYGLKKMRLQITRPFAYGRTNQTFLVLEAYEERYVMDHEMVYNPVMYTSHMRFTKHNAANLRGVPSFHLAKLPTICKDGFTELSTALFDLEVGLPYFRSHYRAAVLFIDGDRALFARKRYTDHFLEAAFLPLRILAMDRNDTKAAKKLSDWMDEVLDKPSLLPKCLVEELEGDATAFKASFVGKANCPLDDFVLAKIEEMKKVVALGIKDGVTWSEPEWRIIGGAARFGKVLNPPTMVDTIREKIREEANITNGESQQLNELIDTDTPYFDIPIDGFEVARVFVAELPEALANYHMGTYGERGLLTVEEFQKTMGKFDGQFLAHLKTKSNPLLKSFLCPK